jgi:hypothetical protein
LSEFTVKLIQEKEPVTTAASHGVSFLRNWHVVLLEDGT